MTDFDTSRAIRALKAEFGTTEALRQNFTPRELALALYPDSCPPRWCVDCVVDEDDPEFPQPPAPIRVCEMNEAMVAFCRGCCDEHACRGSETITFGRPEEITGHDVLCPPKES